jgi:hypothetical protein
LVPPSSINYSFLSGCRIILKEPDLNVVFADDVLSAALTGRIIIYFFSLLLSSLSIEDKNMSF